MQKVFDAISRSLSERMLGHALALLRSVVTDSGDASFSDRWHSLHDNYRRVADYFLSGADDPNRQEVVDGLIHDAFILMDDVYRRWLYRDNTHLQQELANAPRGHNNPQDAFAFYRLRSLQYWDLDDLMALVANPEMEDEALMAISGLTLNLLQTFSANGILYLLRIAAEAEEMCLKERAWVGLLLVLLRYDARLRFFPEVAGVLQDLIDTEEGRVLARTAMTCLLRTLGTEWAGEAYRSLQDQIAARLNEILKTHDLNNPQLSADELDAFSQRLGEVSGGLTDKTMANFSHVQKQQLDSHFAMLSSLYSSSFFAEPYRWWLPYAPDYLPEEARRYSSMLASLPMGDLCDSDKYALVYGLSGMSGIMGENQDRVMTVPSQEETADPMLCNAYVKQAYRFFMLNPWNIENPFPLLKSLASTHLLRILNPTAAEKHITASHCLACRAYDTAAEIYAIIADTVSTAEIYRDYGICLQRTERYEEACVAYRRSLELSASEWVLRQLEDCLRKQHLYEDALPVLDSLLAINPTNTGYLYEKAKCLEHLELFAEALPQYYRIELTAPGNVDVLRAIAWCCYMCNEYDSAEAYYKKVFATGHSKPIDDLNYGHLLLSRGDRLEAFMSYQRCMMQIDSIKDFLLLFRPDRKYLLEKGISKSDIYFIEDQLILQSAVGGK